MFVTRSFILTGSIKGGSVFCYMRKEEDRMKARASSCPSQARYMVRACDLLPNDVRSSDPVSASTLYLN